MAYPRIVKRADWLDAQGCQRITNGDIQVDFRGGGSMRFDVDSLNRHKRHDMERWSCRHAQVGVLLQEGGLPINLVVTDWPDKEDQAAEQPAASPVPAAPAQESAMDDIAALSTIRTLLDRISILGQQLAAKGAPIAFAHERAVNDLDPNAFAALALEMAGDVERMREMAMAARTLIHERARR